MTCRKKKKGANGTGNLRLRPDGRWEARIRFGGNRRTSEYANTQAEARKKLTKMASEIDNGTYIEPSNITLKTWIDDWMELFVASTVKQLTYDQYVCECRHIKDYLGDIKLYNLKSSHIQAFYNNLLKNGLSPKTIKNIHGVLHKALDQAVDLDYIRNNPSNKCKLPKVIRKEIQPMDSAQIKEFIALIENNRFRNLFYTTLFTGLRRGEVLGITWDCVDFEKCTLTINKQLKRDTHYANYHYILDSTKNSKSRTIRVASNVMTVLADQKKWQENAQNRAGNAWNNKMNLVFTNELGSNLTHDIVYDSFKKIARKLGRPDLRFHDLRHSYATLCLLSGDDIKTVSHNLGHSSSSFTLDRYGHVTDDMMLRSAENVEKYIDNIS